MPAVWAYSKRLPDTGRSVTDPKGRASNPNPNPNQVVETSVGWWLRRYNVSRHEGAELYAALLERHGFPVARVSTGRLIETGAQMRAYILAFPRDGYWGQVDMWFARDAALLRRASPLMRARKSFFAFL